jgi:hypothetical protein
VYLTNKKNVTRHQKCISRAACLLAALLVIPSVKAEEGDVHIVLHGLSLHSQARENGRDWNQVNAGLALRYELDTSWSMQLGGYRNSMNRTSAYALADWTPLQVDQLQIGGLVGVMTGYKSDLRPALGGVVRWQREHLSLALRLVPRKNAIVCMELGWRI